VPCTVPSIRTVCPSRSILRASTPFPATQRGLAILFLSNALLTSRAKKASVILSRIRRTRAWAASASSRAACSSNSWCVWLRRLVPLSDVLRDAEQPDGTALRVRLHLAAAVEPAGGPVTANDPVLELVTLARLDRPLNGSQDALAVGGVEQLPVAIEGDPLVEGDAEDDAKLVGSVDGLITSAQNSGSAGQRWVGRPRIASARRPT